MTVEACLPAELRGATITKLAVGLSGAGVYRVDAADRSFVLKIGDGSVPLAAWQRTVHVQRAAADAGVAPRVVHVDEAQRAVVSELVVDRSFPAYVGTPDTRAAALAQLAETLRRLHALPLPAGETRPPLASLETTWSALAGFALPDFVVEAAARVRTEPAPASGRPPVLSHNDLNPTNLIYDGERVLLLDWETAGPNDAYFDLATIAVFLRLDDAACLRLLSSHDATPVDELPARFRYDRRLVAVLCGSVFLDLARQQGHPGGTGETLASAAGLAELYPRMRAGTLNVATADGQWLMGLALVKAGA